MLKQRILTALILIPLVVLAILYLPTTTLMLLFAVVLGLAAWEWSRIAGWQETVGQLFYVAAMALILWDLNIFLMQQADRMQIFLWVAAAWWLLALFLVWQYQFSKITQLINARWLKSLMGFLILLPTWFALSHLHQSRGGDWLLFLLVLIWTADSGAYFAGRRWGKHKLAKRVSPGKTWEGVAGAVVSSLLLTLLWLWWSNLAMPAALWLLLLSVLTVLASILGDLLESLFKRQTGIKDSSQLLPGHGGILDRIDSLTAAAPIFVLGLGFIL